MGLNARWTAERHGCIVNAAGAQPCIVDGVDVSHSLARRFNAPFTVIFTIWFSFLGIILVVIALVGALISLFRRKRA
ncbi:hypothetical protein KUL25_07695 [Rhodobacteraceae bacterium N5(2021)]|uniref:Uncharacterized protein n=1 Tax=Gymnodinialimonas phycosphaerae TaxID=2841589 RepID=A0A975TY51_9RHOB|nr:hypothetical protein [Gymnodinialimonas phycosphaerae]MBY4892645.1 hypothetical protein [Gymnodinialimonas phycosphaerae]